MTAKDFLRTLSNADHLMILMAVRKAGTLTTHALCSDIRMGYVQAGKQLRELRKLGLLKMDRVPSGNQGGVVNLYRVPGELIQWLALTEVVFSHIEGDANGEEQI